MYILGVNGGVRIGYQDISATLMKDGKVLFAIEEERLNRIKFSPGQLPELAIEECLKQANISIRDIDIVASHGSTWGDEYAQKLTNYFLYTFGFCPKLEFVHHHDSHSSSAFYASGFNQAMVISIDASGDSVSTQLSVGKGNSMELFKRYYRPNSLGIYYSLFTQFCGFRRDSDEYKLMGLSAYGNRNKYDMSHILNFDNGELLLNEKYMKSIPKGESQPTRQEMAFSDLLLQEFGSKRLKHEPFDQRFKDVAASTQAQLENTIIEMVHYFYRETGIRKICFAGGVALNCLVNQKVMNLDFIDDIYVQPASSDAGISMGAAMYVASKNGFKIEPITSALLGMEFTNEEIKKTLDDIGVDYLEIKNPSKTAAELVSQNKIIGWFQGRMEFGPRALGARSILANPAMPDVKNVINAKIKYRESYRPFCPSVVEEESSNYFIGKAPISPFMNITFDVKEEMKAVIPGVVHADGTARIQTVSKNNNPIYYEFLIELKKLTGHPVSVNTSFNTNNEPIVASPSDAIASFYRSGLDALVIGNFLLTKRNTKNPDYS
ncbi:MAG: carbamoyltransferase C-terminal domain-containing protein [Bacteroidota bacterium]